MELETNKSHKDILNTIKIENPFLFELLEKQLENKWEIVKGDDGKTVQNACSEEDKDEIINNIQNYHI